ncbi:capsular associated protein [Coprinopsis cinerea AmutBmut pab1-1]|nr:capsular associated protein [Coprinopsis cinerea AmutBmut pab1-1]
MTRAKTALAILSLPFRNGYIFLLCVAIVFMQAGFHAGSRDRDRTSAVLLLGATPEIREELLSKTRGLVKKSDAEHPIPKLMDEAEARFRDKLGRQSKTLKAAVAEYKRRYKRPPPKGFDEWWKFVQRNDVKLVDEYDGLVEDLEPFWGMSGVELRRRAVQAGELPFVDLVRIRNGKSESVNLKDEGVSGRAEGFRSMITRFVDKLPDMDFPINALAESRVLVPWEHQHYPNMTTQDSSGGLNAMLGGPFQADWAGQGNVWDAWRRTCSPSSAGRRILTTLQSQGPSGHNYFDPQGLPSGDDFYFVPNITASHVDFCSNPQLHLDQGLFYSDWRSIHALYPIFSPTKAPGFMDIRIPSHYYFGNTPRYTYGWDYVNLELKEVDSMEVPWEKKVDKVYWRGASTGGGNHPPGFANRFHRHRFVQMASDTSDFNRTLTFVDPDDSSRLLTASVTSQKLNPEVMDVAFVKAVREEIYPGGAEALREKNRFEDSVELGRHWGYKYLLDMDGVGYSGRFMAFLASDSVPLKTSVYREFYEGWIEPWLHYIPLSSSYHEVYNIHAYFSGPTQSTLEAYHSTESDAEASSTPTGDDTVDGADPQRRDQSEGQTGPSQSIEVRRSVEADRRLRRIARAGKQWKRTMGRHADIEAYVYRLCLEWARLLADDRNSMDYSSFKIL